MPKKPNPAEPKPCGSCQHLQLISPGDDAGYCRRFPRVWIIRDEVGGWCYPEQAVTDTCGEFDRKLNS